MFHIAIADDDELCMALTAEMMKRYVSENPDTGIAFTCFSTPHELLHTVESGTVYDAFLLDVVMPGMTGIDLARDLRRMGIGVPVIFLTSETQYALDAFRVGATQYLVKGFTYEELKAAMDQSIKVVSRERRRRIILNTRTGYRHIFCRNIMYSVAGPDWQDVVLDSNEVLQVPMTHEALAEKLTQSVNFVSVGDSHIVNLFYVTDLEADAMTMVDSHTLPVPQEQSPAILDAYRSFMAALSKKRSDLL